MVAGLAPSRMQSAAVRSAWIMEKRGGLTGVPFVRSGAIWGALDESKIKAVAPPAG